MIPSTVIFVSLALATAGISSCNAKKEKDERTKDQQVDANANKDGSKDKEADKAVTPSTSPNSIKKVDVSGSLGAVPSICAFGSMGYSGASVTVFNLDKQLSVLSDFVVVAGATTPHLIAPAVGNFVKSDELLIAAAINPMQIYVSVPSEIRFFKKESGLATDPEKFFPYTQSWEDGISIAACDVDGDGLSDIITSTTINGNPRDGLPIKIFKSGKAKDEITSFAAYPPTMRQGVSVSCGDIDNDGKAEIISAPGPGTEREMHIWKFVGPGKPLEKVKSITAPFPNVNLAFGDINGDGYDDLIISKKVILNSNDSSGPKLNIYSGKDFAPLFTGVAYTDKTLVANVYNQYGAVTAAGNYQIGNGKMELVTIADYSSGLPNRIYVYNAPEDTSGTAVVSTPLPTNRWYSDGRLSCSQPAKQ